VAGWLVVVNTVMNILVDHLREDSAVFVRIPTPQYEILRILLHL
jgi:hypothetical protein